MTLVGGKVCDGTALKPLTVLPRKTIETESPLWGDKSDDAALVYQEKGFIQCALFQLWMMGCFTFFAFFPDQKAPWAHYFQCDIYLNTRK
jgi:hypothetical protein